MGSLEPPFHKKALLTLWVVYTTVVAFVTNKTDR